MERVAPFIKRSPKKTSSKWNMRLGPSKDPEKYLLIKIIGKGEYGATYMAQNVNRENEEDEFYAVKLLTQPEDMEDEDIEELKQDWRKETNCLKSVMKICKDVGILCYKDSFIWEKDGKKEFVIVTPYLKDYITLKKYLDKEDNILSENDAKDIYKKIINVKNKLTELCINHSDLHLENIMINPQTKDIKIIDLGRCQTPQEEIIEWHYNFSKWKKYSDDTRLEDLREALYQKVYPEGENEDFFQMLKEHAPIQMYKPGCKMGGEIQEITPKIFKNEIKCLIKLSGLSTYSYTKKIIILALYDFLVLNKDIFDSIPKIKAPLMEQLQQIKKQDKDFEPYYQKLK